MTAATFISQVSAMKGLLPAMIEHLTMLAPMLTESDREQSVKELSRHSNELITLEGELTTIMDKGEADFRALKKKSWSKLTKRSKKSDLKTAEANLDANLKNL